MPIPIQPGLIVLHGNRLELLRDAVFDWLARNPLAPLEEEIFLVQSNAAAEWLKLSLATGTGLCAATRFELPGRFLWRCYRQVLGPRVEPRSALERNALVWRLMHLLPACLERPGFEPVARFLADRALDRRLQLAHRLADLYDQYQVYRADWLAAWERGRCVLIGANGRAQPLPEDQRWQAELWRVLLAGLDPDRRASARPDVHRAFMEAIAARAAPVPPLPRRVVLFGASQVSVQGLEALAALAGRMQIVAAIPNPCRFHWADIIEGREALPIARRRSPGREGQALADVSLEAMHLHAHPLLAAWGRQGRDFMRLLDAFDDADTETIRRRFGIDRIELFDEGPGTTLLQQVQVAIRDLLPLAEHAERQVALDDRSIVFQTAHGVEREVEILHDHLLSLLAEGSLRPRDIIVMVPDIEVFAPSIRAVFGRLDRDDPRRIPFDIADLRRRGSNPLVVALEWLLRLPDQRVRLQELRDLLDVSAVAARHGIEAAALPTLFDWLAAAGVRWGLDVAHRERLGLGAAGEQNTWRFGIRRLLLGYASGDVDADVGAYAGIEPFDEIGGLDTPVVGALIELVDRLSTWSSLAASDATPREWATRGRALLDDFFEATDDRERLTLAALHDALATWLEACEAAAFDERLPIAVMREAWLAGIDGLETTRRFLTGGVTFCTLMPLRAVPFEVVCLLGMNDGDFPRAPQRNDFDLLAAPGQQRPGDRSRRDDDRYLMLEALLSARRTLYVSWRGRNPRDNTTEPPSVLVAQLRDYLASAWRGAAGGDLLPQLTTEHPLQPFSRRYFEAEGGLTTHAREWRAMHATARGGTDAVPYARAGPHDATLDIAELERFVRNPVKSFFARRLDVGAPEAIAPVDDDETFAVAGLDAYRLRAALLDAPDAALDEGVEAVLARRVARLSRAGGLPMFALGTRVVDAELPQARLALERWVGYRHAYPQRVPRYPLRFEDGDLAIEDGLDDLCADGECQVWLAMTPSRLLDRKAPRAARLISAWLKLLVASACRHRVRGLLIGSDATLCMTPPAFDDARATLLDLLRLWRDGMATPLPFAIATGLAALDGGAQAEVAYDGSYQRPDGEGAEFCLRRTYPDYRALIDDGRFEKLVARIAQPLATWVRDSVTVEPASTT